MGLWRLTYFDNHASRRVHLVVDAPSIFDALWFAHQPYMGLHREIGSACDHCSKSPTGRFVFVESEPLPTPKQRKE